MAPKKVSEKSKRNLMPPFPKGVSGNPAGSKKGHFTKDQVKGIIGRFMHMTLEEVEKSLESTELTMAERLVCQAIIAANDNADCTRFDFLLTRSIGRVKEELELSQAKSFILRKRDGEEIHMGVKEVKVIEGEKE